MNTGNYKLQLANIRKFVLSTNFSLQGAPRFAHPGKLKFVLRTFVVLAILSGLFCQIAFAQAGQAEIVGEITDPTGAVIPNVRVILTEKQTNRQVETVSDDHGNFIFTNQRPGVYSVEFKFTGLTHLVRENITLTTGERIRVDAELAAISLEEIVTVETDAPLLRTDTSSLGQVIDHKKVVDLPLNGRSFLSIVGLAPGVAQPPRTTEGASLPRINGGRPRTNEYLFDGISVLQPEPGQVAFFPVVDAIQEFKVEINNPPAEFGRFNGGVVNLSTKAGTNEFHGSAFEFLRNEVLNARNLFAPVGQSKPVFRRNQFGGVVGGRIIRDKTFFFADYQGTRQLVGRIRTSTVPTAANRSGNFASSLGALLYRTPAGAVTTTAAGNTPIMVTDTAGNQIQVRQNQIFRPADKLAYAGNIVPLADFDQSALRLLQRYPLPTAAGAANNFTRVGNERQDQNQFDVRIDHRFDDNSTLFGRYSFAKDFSDPVAPLPDGSGAIANGAIGTTATRADSVALNYVRAFSTRLLNELRFGYTRRDVERRSTATVGNNTDLLRGIPETAAFRETLPLIAIAGFQQLGSSINTATDFSTDVTEFFDAVSYQTGKHSFKFGADFRRERLDVLQPPRPASLRLTRC